MKPPSKPPAAPKRAATKPRAAAAAPPPIASADDGAVHIAALRGKADIEAAEALLAKRAQIKQLEGEVDELKARLIAAMGNARVARAGVRVLTITAVPPSPPTPDVTITKEMLGQVIPGKRGRPGHTQLVVK